MNFLLTSATTALQTQGAFGHPPPRSEWASDPGCHSGRFPGQRAIMWNCQPVDIPHLLAKQWDRVCPFLCNFSTILYHIFFNFADEITKIPLRSYLDNSLPGR